MNIIDRAMSNTMRRWSYVWHAAKYLNLAATTWNTCTKALSDTMKNGFYHSSLWCGYINRVIFNESAHRPIQSKSGNVFLPVFLCLVLPSPLPWFKRKRSQPGQNFPLNFPWIGRSIYVLSYFLGYWCYYPHTSNNLMVSRAYLKINPWLYDK